MKTYNLVMIILLSFILLFSACKKDDTTPTPPARTDIHLDSSLQLGKYLVDKDGRTLYYFSNDVNGLSNCTGGCLTNWKPFNADSASSTIGNGLSATDFSSITPAAGTKQSTYKGWPLYYYTPGGTAEPAGATTGEGVGNIWFVAKPDYSVMIANYQLTGSDGVNYLGTYASGDGRTLYFTDEVGNTLYMFARDSAFINKFTAADFSNNAIWPLYEKENITAPSILDKSLFVVIDVHGRKQLSYNGWPLYYYGGDNMIRGANKGITIPPTQPVGSIWKIINKETGPAPRL